MSSGAAVAGMGAVCAAGIGVDSGYDAVAAGRDGLVPFDLFDVKLQRQPLCAQVAHDLGRYLALSDGNRTLAMALCAADEAMRCAPTVHRVRLGVVFATTVAGMPRTERFYRSVIADPAALSLAAQELALHEATSLAARICAHVDGQGFHTISTACSSGLHAIGVAMRLVKQGAFDACLAVGADALSVLTVRGFASLMLLDPEGCRPFDCRRAGISLGEGAGAMLLISSELARSIPSEIAIAGWGASADCHHMTAPHPEGNGAVRAVQAALAEAALDSTAIDFIATHGTGTPDNDRAELAAMARVFGTSLPPFCSMKRTLGHTLAASGILEAVFAVRAMQENRVPPTAGFGQIDPAIGHAPAPGGARPIRALLKNSFGFGGNNAAAAFTRIGAGE